jgi:hypothetical protein
VDGAVNVYVVGFFNNWVLTLRRAETERARCPTAYAVRMRYWAAHTAGPEHAFDAVASHHRADGQHPHHRPGKGFGPRRRWARSRFGCGGGSGGDEAATLLLRLIFGQRRSKVAPAGAAPPGDTSAHCARQAAMASRTAVMPPPSRISEQSKSASRWLRRWARMIPQAREGRPKRPPARMRMPRATPARHWESSLFFRARP